MLPCVQLRLKRIFHTAFHVRHANRRGNFSLIADSQDEDALREMVRQTKVVITTVGPYTLYGSTLVKVCAENGVSTWTCFFR